MRVEVSIINVYKQANFKIYYNRKTSNKDSNHFITKTKQYKKKQDRVY
jgi:hypothetical protein